MNKYIFALLMICLSAPMFAQTTSDADKIVGVWIPADKKSHIKIEKIGNKYFGKVIWMKEPNDKDTGKPQLDDNNPDENLRNQPVLGLRIMKDFVFEANGVFKSGTVYDPNKGKTYCGKITIIDSDHLDLRGSICGFSLLGRTETWERLKQ